MGEILALTITLLLKIGVTGFALGFILYQCSCVMATLFYVVFVDKKNADLSQPKLFNEACETLERGEQVLTIHIFKGFLRHALWSSVFRPAVPNILMWKGAKELIERESKKQTFIKKLSQFLDKTMKNVNVWNKPHAYVIRWVIWKICVTRKWCDRILVSLPLLAYQDSFCDTKMRAEQRLEILSEKRRKFRRAEYLPGHLAKLRNRILDTAETIKQVERDILSTEAEASSAQVDDNRLEQLLVPLFTKRIKLQEEEKALDKEFSTEAALYKKSLQVDFAETMDFLSRLHPFEFDLRELLLEDEEARQELYELYMDEEDHLKGLSVLQKRLIETPSSYFKEQIEKEIELFKEDIRSIEMELIAPLSHRELIEKKAKDLSVKLEKLRMSFPCIFPEPDTKTEVTT